MNTDDLIEQLSRDVSAIRPLPPPALRALRWLALALPYAAVVVLLHGELPGAGRMLSDTRFLVEQAAALATTVTAAIGAFSLLVPGTSRWPASLAIVPLAVWLLTLGQGCVDDWLRLGPAGLGVVSDWGCLPPMLALGIVPLPAILAMLRRGAPIAPRATTALAALSVAALTNFALQFFHVGDVSVMVLVWHFGGTMLFAAIAGLLGRRILDWRHPAANAAL